MKKAGFFDQVDPDQCGGKGANLVTLAANRFPVPPGFIVTRHAYSLFESSNGMPQTVEREIAGCYRELVAQSGNARVAIRSSATAEDTATASFAGQYETYLDVEGEDAVIEHVVECWRSLRSERSALYRKMMRIPDEGLQMAVIVQAMLDPRSAGVIFTANPYTMDKNRMIVESSWGRGENVVSGAVTPDYFEIVAGDGFEIVRKLAGSAPGGADAVSAPANRADGPGSRPAWSISDDALRDLCAMAREIEGLFGGPQDIEWALAEDGSLSILQARPITRFRECRSA